jgi:serine/threonine protein kinase
MLLAVKLYKFKFEFKMFSLPNDLCGQMTTAIAIEDVRREVRILSSLTGHSNLVQFYDAFEDEDNVYIVME